MSLRHYQKHQERDKYEFDAFYAREDNDYLSLKRWRILNRRRNYEEKSSDGGYWNWLWYFIRPN